VVARLGVTLAGLARRRPLSAGPGFGLQRFVKEIGDGSHHVERT